MPVPVPPIIPGDSGAMRALAGILRSQARDLGNALTAAVGDARRPTFEGPAGDRFRERIAGLQGSLGGAEDDLRSLAKRIDDAADQVDAAQRAHDQAVAENEREQAQRQQHVGAGA